MGAPFHLHLEELTLIQVGVDGEVVILEVLPLAVAHPRLFGQELLHRERVADVQVQVKDCSIEHVRHRLHDPLACLRMNPVDVDAPSGLVHYIGATGGVRGRVNVEGGQQRHKEEKWEGEGLLGMIRGWMILSVV